MTEEANDANTLAKIYCNGYVFCTSDGSRFRRVDVERVEPNDSSGGLCSTLRLHTQDACGRKRKHQSVQEEDDESNTDTNLVADFDYGVDLESSLENYSYCEEPCSHSCDNGTTTTTTGPAHFVVANECGDSWTRLTDTQKDVLRQIQERVDEDNRAKRYFTCAVMEGPGGCGKTRIMSYVMNHAPRTTLVLYVTKQNKRVQDFIHNDCLCGETDPKMTKPYDLSPLGPVYVRALVLCNISVGRYTMTAEKLAYAIASLRPSDFHSNTTLTRLGLGVENFTERAATGVERDPTSVRRNIIVMMDEYTMLQPPLVHALVYTLRRECKNTSLLLLMGGDKFQSGPVNWNNNADLLARQQADRERYTADLRHEIRVKMDYDPLELKMENLQRCRGDRALGACVKRLRRVCEESGSGRWNNGVVHTVLAKYSAESGVKLYRQDADGIKRIVPSDPDVLDFATGGEEEESEKSFDEYVKELENEDWDERGIEFRVATTGPLAEPTYDVSPLVDHFVRLYAKLAEISFPSVVTNTWADEGWPTIVYESVSAIRHLFPVFVVLTNRSCNRFAETFLLALSTKVKERVCDVPVPAGLAGKIALRETWNGHLRYTFRRCVRSLQIDEGDALKRQTLFVGMVYKMTSTFADDPTCYLCNGETVVLTSIVFDSADLTSMNAVRLRKLDRDSDAELVLETGRNRNRMSEQEKRCIMPFVPHLSENIYQMQGNTMPRDAKTFVDLVNAPCRSVYVAVSRFQNSASIEGIVIST